MRRGSAPLTIRCATRWASVLVLPEPAPAMTSSGAGAPSHADAMLDGAALLGIELLEIGGRYRKDLGTGESPGGRATQQSRFPFCSQWPCGCRYFASGVGNTAARICPPGVVQ